MFANSRRNLQDALLAGLVLAMLTGLVALAACQQPVVLPGRGDIGVTVDEILADPQRYLGRGVVADGQADRIVAERVIALRSQTSAQGMLAILSDQAVKTVDSIQPGDVLHVAGVVQTMTREQLKQVEQQLGIQLDEDRLLNLANQAPFLIAERVSK